MKLYFCWKNNGLLLLCRLLVLQIYRGGFLFTTAALPYTFCWIKPISFPIICPLITLVSLLPITFLIEHWNPLVAILAVLHAWWSGGRGILTELSLCYSIVQHFSNAHCTILHNHNEQFFQVGLLDRALMGLVLSPPSTSVSSDFMVLCTCFFLLKLYLLHFTL